MASHRSRALFTSSAPLLLILTPACSGGEGRTSDTASASATSPGTITITGTGTTTAGTESGSSTGGCPAPQQCGDVCCEDGQACVLHISHNGDDRFAEYQGLENAARNAKINMWGACNPVPCD